MVADLFHAEGLDDNDPDSATGVSTVGSSEAVMLAGLAILGTTFTGEFEPVADIAQVLDEVAAGGGPDVPLHVDAASGGFVAPFIHPDLEWDFRLGRVVSINVSGHKYGMTYPGIGFVVWRSPEYLPEDLVFRVNYLGGDMPTFTLNFSRPGNQLLGQYYNFVRLGREGYTKVMLSLQESARRFAEEVALIDELQVISDGSAIPVVTFEVAGDPGFTVFDISHELRSHGLQVPAYTMPANAENVAVLRAVFKEGLSADMAHKVALYVKDAVEAIKGGGRAVSKTACASVAGIALG